jgi:hypothetical protein
LGQLVSVGSRKRIFASPCSSISRFTLYRPLRPRGWQTIVSVASHTSDRLKASFGIRGREPARPEQIKNTKEPRGLCGRGQGFTPVGGNRRGVIVGKCSENAVTAITPQEERPVSFLRLPLAGRGAVNGKASQPAASNCRTSNSRGRQTYRLGWCGLRLVKKKTA